MRASSGLALDRGKNAMELAAALGGLKGPIMKVAQLLATIPDALPPEYAAELMKLQSDAPPMGWPFVKRRMAAELGPTGAANSQASNIIPAAAASLGQVHRARASDGSDLACKLQYPDMQSAVEADLRQLQLIFAIHRRMDPVIDTTEIAKEIGARIREELDYRREAKHAALYGNAPGIRLIRVPQVWSELSTGRLLTLDWLEGDRLLAHRNDELEIRKSSAPRCSRRGGGRLAATGSSMAIRISATTPYSRATVARAESTCSITAASASLPPKFVGGVVDLYRGLLTADDDSSCMRMRPGASGGSAGK